MSAGEAIDGTQPPGIRRWSNGTTNTTNITALDNERLQWNTGDIILNRPALSRWHPDYAEEFTRYVEGL